MNITDPNNYYLLRWRFDFQTGGSRFGLWSQTGNLESDGAWRQLRAGLEVKRAYIEGKHYVSGVIRTLAECDGHDFVMFEWMANAFFDPFSVRGNKTPYTSIAGLSMVCREKIISVMTDGLANIRDRPTAHKNLNFATYGK